MNHGEAIYCRTWIDRPASAGDTHERCGGCLTSPDPLCAACGAPTVHLLDAGAHILTLCQRCYTTVLACRAQAAAEATTTIARAAKAEKERIA